MVQPPVASVARLAWRRQGTEDGERLVPEEAAVAFTYNGGSYAVMMATPQNLDDFAVGFSITEGIVSSAAQIKQLEIVEEEIGIELRMWLDDTTAQALSDRRRHMAGPTGCGLCGIESLTEAVRVSPHVREGMAYSPAEIMRALESLGGQQELNRQTRAMHGAAFWKRGEGIVALREDVGRHNALDKLAGYLARNDIAGHSGILLITSRVSVEMVQKAAMIGVPVLVAVSAPTALAIRTAEKAGITLVAIARNDSFEIFTHPHRITTETSAHVPALSHV